MSCASKQTKVKDLKLRVELSKLYEAEFNQPDLHDRVLVFDVVASLQDGLSIANVEENERNENEGNENEASSQSEHGSDGETAVRVGIENKGMRVNTGDENETESHDCEIPSKNANGDQQIEKQLSNESVDEHIGTATNENETVLIDDETSEIQEANKTEVTNEHEAALNENVELNQIANNGTKMKGQLESEITNGDNDVNPSLNDKEQSEISSESNEARSYSTSEGQIIQQHKFYIHSSWLAVQSSYFRSLFFSEKKESSSTEFHVQISTSEEQAHLMLLEAMYKIDSLNNAGVDELLKVLKLAHKYDVKFVFKKCKYHLQAGVVSLKICEKIMRFIKVDNTITDVEDLASTLQSFLAKEFSPLDKTWQTTSFEELCEPSVRYLLSSDELVAESENTIFHALVFWIEHYGIENVSNSKELPSLLSVVRFELMPIGYLYDIVQHNSVAKRLVDFKDHYLRGISYHALSGTRRQLLLPQPVRRKASTKLLIAYTWMVPRDELDKLVGNDKTIKSDEFWYCGYKMVLVINHVAKVKDFGENQAMFKATLSLGILNLTEQSEVMIQWQPARQLPIFTSVAQIYTFKKNACMSSVDIEYEMATTPGPPPQSGNGFSVSSPTTSVSPSGGTTTTPGLMSSTCHPSPNGGFSFSSPTTSVSPNAGTTTTPGLMSSTCHPSPNGGFSFSSPTTSVSPNAGTATTPGLMSSTCHPSPNGGFSFSTPTTSVSPSAGTTTTPGLMSSTCHPSPNGGFSFSSPTPSVSPSAGTTTTPGLMSSLRQARKPNSSRLRFGTKPRATSKASKPASVKKQESPTTPWFRLYIYAKINLV